jgi:hypothetical protein
MRRRLLLILIPLLWLDAARAIASDYYVDNVAGDDRNDGTAAQAVGEYVGPTRTIQRALQRAGKGDRVIINNTGIAYQEGITLQGGRQSGTIAAPFELIGNGAILDGTRPVPAAAWLHYEGHVFRYRPPKMSFQLLFLDDKPAARIPIASRPQIEQLQPLQWCLFEGHVYFCVEEGRLPQSYSLSFTGLQTGITLYEVRNVVIRDLVVQGFQLDGINAHDGVFGATFSEVTCRGNGRSGISVGGASRVRIEASLVGNNGTAQVRTEGACRAEIVGCDLLDNTAPKIVRDGGKVVVND